MARERNDDAAVKVEHAALDLSWLFAHPRVIAQEIGISRRRLDELHRRSAGPPRIRIGRHVMYSRESVREWLLEREERQRRR
jgi:predicted DNA-binding transcriptional regulator AlpA